MRPRSFQRASAARRPSNGVAYDTGKRCMQVPCARKKMGAPCRAGQRHLSTPLVQRGCNLLIL